MTNPDGDRPALGKARIGLLGRLTAGVVPFDLELTACFYFSHWRILARMRMRWFSGFFSLRSLKANHQIRNLSRSERENGTEPTNPPSPLRESCPMLAKCLKAEGPRKEKEKGAGPGKGSRPFSLPARASLFFPDEKKPSAGLDARRQGKVRGDGFPDQGSRPNVEPMRGLFSETFHATARWREKNHTASDFCLSNHPFGPVSPGVMALT